MKSCASCVFSLVLIVVIVSAFIGIIGWLFATEFVIFEILWSIASFLFYAIVFVLVLVGIIYVYLELFG